MQQGSYSTVTTLKKALIILETISENQPVRAVDLAQITGLSRSNINRFLATLQELGYVESADGKTFQLGYKIFVIGNSVPKRDQLTAIVYPHLQSLAELSQENVNLAVLYNQNVLYIDKVESPMYVKLDREIGSADPVYCTALGKVLLTGMNDDELTAFASTLHYIPRTDSTLTNPEDFIADVKKARKDGYATDMGELSEEIRCIAAPIMDRDNRVVAGISISAPAMRLSLKRLSELRPRLVAAAVSISKALGYQA